MGHGIADVLRGHRRGAEMGTWLLAVDPDSVQLQVSVPCLKGMASSMAPVGECERSWAEMAGVPALWLDVCLLLLVGGLFGMCCLGPCCGLAEPERSCRSRYPWHGSSRAMLCAARGLQARLAVVSVFGASLGVPAAVWIGCLAVSSAVRAGMVLCGLDAAGLALSRSTGPKQSRVEVPEPTVSLNDVELDLTDLDRWPHMSSPGRRAGVMVSAGSSRRTATAGRGAAPAPAIMHKKNRMQ